MFSSQFHGLLADDPGHRRDDGAVAQVQLGLLDQGLPLRHLRQGGFRASLADGHLLRRGHGGLDRGVGLGDALVGLLDGALRRPRCSARLRARRPCARPRVACARGRDGDRGIVLLARNLVLVDQQFVARDVVVGFFVRLASASRTWACADSRRACAASNWRCAPSRNAAASRACRRSRLQLARRVGVGDRNIDARAFERRFGVGQVGFRLGERDFVVLRIDADQHVARVHELLVFRLHLDDVPVDPRADGVDVPVDLRVVGAIRRC